MFSIVSYATAHFASRDPNDNQVRVLSKTNVIVHMGRLAVLSATLLLASIAALGVDAAQLYKKGVEQERAGAFAKAYIYYKQAAALEPGNHLYWLRSQAVKTRAALQAIPSEGALPAQFSLEAAPPPVQKMEEANPKDLAEARKPQPPAELKASAERKDFDLSGDARVLFEKVAQSFGLDCVFDSDYQPGRSIRFRMDAVDYREALHGVELATGSFIVPLTARVFLVAKDTPEKRRDLEPWVTVSVDVPQATSAQELTQISTAVQQAMAVERVSFDAHTNTVMLRGPISKVIPARAIFEELMRHRAEVRVELDFLEVDRNDMLNYGVSLPDLFQIQPFSSVGGATTTLANLARWGPQGTIFTLAIADAQALANFSNTAARSLTHMELRSVDGQPVSFHVGDRYPVLTAGYYGQANVSAAPVSSNRFASPTVSPTTNTPGNLLQSASAFGNVANPSGVVVGDFNHDGLQDFAASSSSGNLVAVFLGNGDGTFGNPRTFATGQNPSAILAVDVNGDGNLDLITADADSNTVSVLLGNGDGTFKAASPFTVGTKPAALASDDFNRDGKPDLAVANADSNNISILLGVGDGTFQQPLTVPAGTSPRALVIADFNRDGLPDVAVANYSSNDLWILLSNGDGTFTQAATYATGNAPRGLATGDLNRDSFTDLVVANSASNTISVFLGDGTGKFGGGLQVPVGSGPVSLVTADFNNDLLEDVAVANAADSTVSLLLGLGNGTFQAAIHFALGAGAQPTALAHADLNRDGYQDLLTANFAASDFSVLIGSPYGGFHDTSGNTYQYTGGQTYTPPPAFTFEDLGLVVKITPHTHGMEEAALEVEAEIKLLTGNALNGVPEIAQRKLQSQVQVGFGQAAIIAGLMASSDARSILGIAGLSTLPGIGPLLRKNTRERQNADVLVVIRPVLVSLPPDESVSRSIWVGSENRPRTPM